MANEVIEFKDISLSFGKVQVLSRLNLKIMSNSIYSLIGESGSGKTTCLRLMNGLLQPDCGQVILENKLIQYDQVVKLRRKMGYVLQGSGLFPHLKVKDNISLIAKRSGWSQKNIANRSREVLEMVNLSISEVLNKYPAQLSGGEKQRIGIARSLFLKPQIMLMDEPFAALDPTTREELQDLFIQLQKKHHLTVVIVTHDLAESFKMSDKIMVLNAGKIEQVGTQSQLILNPANNYIKNYLRCQSVEQKLSKIKINTLINTNLWVLINEKEKLSLKNVETNEVKTFSNQSQIISFLEQIQQNYIYFVSKEHKLFKIYDIIKKIDCTKILLKVKNNDNFQELLKIFLNNLNTRVVMESSEGIFLGEVSKKSLYEM